ncbi:hypothetical protein B296_00035316 [Ensete ventricosum]|uniref:Uncharacterized protein n=1 Tax=Ensete ventricosum TaxID=4639 RepID=A0A426ZRT0_ENSVE|nr:hypothetical protein B296_00035316 [Ensete ventricosum]
MEEFFPSGEREQEKERGLGVLGGGEAFAELGGAGEGALVEPGIGVHRHRLASELLHMNRRHDRLQQGKQPLDPHRSSSAVAAEPIASTLSTSTALPLLSSRLARSFPFRPPRKGQKDRKINGGFNEGRGGK